MALSTVAQAHINHARRNYDLYRKLRSEGEFLDWALTVLFYSALHLVTAHACEEHAALDNDHASLRRYVAQNLLSLRRAYKDLEDASRDCRYEMRIPDDATLESYHEREFRHIQAQMRNRGIAF